jgi:hypothetical protein
MGASPSSSSSTRGRSYSDAVLRGAQLVGAVIKPSSHSHPLSLSSLRTPWRCDGCSWLSNPPSIPPPPSPDSNHLLRPSVPILSEEPATSAAPAVTEVAPAHRLRYRCTTGCDFDWCADCYNTKTS